MIPKFDNNGNLPKGIHRFSLKEVEAVFGSASARRKWLIENFKKVIELAKSTGKIERIFIWGSFVSNKELPQDIDLLLIMKSDFNLENCGAEERKLFDHFQGRITFNADIFWAKSSLGYDTINLWLETYQVAKDLKLRGIVEVIF